MSPRCWPRSAPPRNACNAGNAGNAVTAPRSGPPRWDVTTVSQVTNLAGSASVMDDLKHVFTVVVQEIVQLLNCDRATFWRVGDGDEATLWTMVQPFPPTDGTAMIRIEVPMKEGTIAGSCVHTEKTINIEDVYKVRPPTL